MTRRQAERLGWQFSGWGSDNIPEALMRDASSAPFTAAKAGTHGVTLAGLSLEQVLRSIEAWEHDHPAPVLPVVIEGVV